MSSVQCFFTLTYSEPFVPRLRFTGSDVLEPENFPYYIQIEEHLDDMSWKLLDTDNCRVLSVRDVQLFIKRLRSNIKYTYEKETNKKDSPSFRYHIVGEYGETTFRPHYHGILWFDSRWLADNFNELFVKAWQKRVGAGFTSIGRTDWSFVKKSASSYVAQYLNCFNNLPKVLASVKIRPFAVGSRRPPIGSLFQSDSQVFEIFHKGLTTISFPRKMEDRLLLLRFYPHLRIDCSRSVYAIVCSLLMLELESIDLLNDSLRQRISKVTKNGLTTLKEK